MTGKGKSDPDRFGFVAILGAPNVGKSTLLNFMVGSKVSIVSPKVQTTRARVLGICIEGSTQIVFMDTPGIFTPRRRLDRAMVATAWDGAGDADQVLLLVDAERGLDRDTEAISAHLRKKKITALLAINKIDLVKKPDLLTLTETLSGDGLFSEIFMISAAKGDGVSDLLNYFKVNLPEGPWHFPEDQISDMPMRLLSAEITREKLYLQLKQELPYSTAVETESWEEKDDGSVRIAQVVYVERKGQKGIVLGKGGARIKEIGRAARLELEEILERRVHLFLFVKVREKWGDDPDRYRDWGLNFNA